MSLLFVALLATTTTSAPPDDGGTEVSQPDASAVEELDNRAREAYDARDYEGAAKLFEQAYALSRDPSYLFNVGRVYEEGGNLEQALTFYETFIEQGEVSLEARKAALERVEVLSGVLETRRKKTEAQPEAEDEPEEEAVPEPALEDPADQLWRRRLRISGATLSGVGAVALVAGAVLGGLAQRQVSILEGDEIALEDRRRRIDATNTYAIAADGLFIGGGVVAATGIALLVTSFVGRKGNRGRQARRSWTPMASRNAVTLRFDTRF